MVADPRGPLINIYLLRGAAFIFRRGWYIAGAEPPVEGTGGRGTQMQFRGEWWLGGRLAHCASPSANPAGARDEPHVAHARKIPACCRIPCTLHNEGRIHGD